MPDSRSGLRLLSYNIQAGVGTNRYREYLTHGWKHLLPHRDQEENLEKIASLIKAFDIVGLQEVDLGSFRSRYFNQVTALAELGDFPFSHSQTNRRMGRIAQLGLGILSRKEIIEVGEIKLPGSPGRGALLLRLGTESCPLIVVIVHLALGQRARMTQVNFLGRLLREYDTVVLMGDLNCPADSREIRLLSDLAGLSNPSNGANTFPSWRPIRNLDHILVSRGIAVKDVKVLPHQLSDHLPISLRIEWPPLQHRVNKPKAVSTAPVF